MTIGLRAMTPAEFPAYRAAFVPDYAAEIVSNYGLSPAAAEAQAEREVDRDLPAGPETPGHVLLCVIDETTGDGPIGYIWYRADEDAGYAFVLDFQILSRHRGRGHGGRALAALEGLLAGAGFVEVRLRVAAENIRAQKLYQSGGFRPTGINMSKRFTRQDTEN